MFCMKKLKVLNPKSWDMIDLYQYKSELVKLNNNLYKTNRLDQEETGPAHHKCILRSVPSESIVTNRATIKKYVPLSRFPSTS